VLELQREKGTEAIHSEDAKHSKETQLDPLISHMESLFLSLQNGLIKRGQVLNIDGSLVPFLRIQSMFVDEASDTL
jgi:hypothetical protein